ncbi:MAG: Rrf2 family transcriptional regulator [Defluviitaleaceae bacterium]|nr:Rrf2 family transcriptional regulator [Defluviitaleaceae bacterium]
MKISSKGCYALAALTEMALNADVSPVAVATIAQKLEISKIYLEQVFGLLKKGGVLVATKGAQGGYALREKPSDITVYDILQPIEQGLFETPPPQPFLAVNKLVFEPLNTNTIAFLKSISLEDIATEARSSGDGGMYFI